MFITYCISQIIRSWFKCSPHRPYIRSCSTISPEAMAKEAQNWLFKATNLKIKARREYLEPMYVDDSIIWICYVFSVTN